MKSRPLFLPASKLSHRDKFSPKVRFPEGAFNLEQRETVRAGFLKKVYFFTITSVFTFLPN